ncbi:hypothetical protein [Burkholderia stagnalis]|uniref:hypothetical protein n=1 Tax=Burkholderia stagnalis TaxID=1503054 RepID=UPI00158B8EF7|nr:hypothetical protein [Burkholderia stagnalis]
MNLVDKHQRPPAGGAFESGCTMRFASRKPGLSFRPQQAAFSAWVSNAHHIQVRSRRYQ